MQAHLRRKHQDCRVEKLNYATGKRSKGGSTGEGEKVNWPRMHRRLSIILLCSFAFMPATMASVLQLEGPKIFEESVSRDLQISDHGEIELGVGELFEDDGPASGHSYKKPENREQLSSQTWLKKELLIPNPQARAAHLVVLSEE